MGNMSVGERQKHIERLTGICNFGFGVSSDRSEGYSAFVEKLGQALEGVRQGDSLNLIALSSAVTEICREQQKSVRRIRGQLSGVFERYNSPDQLYNAAVVLDEARAKCPALVHRMPQKFATAIQTVEVFKPDAQRYGKLLSVFSNVCAQTGDHALALETFTPLLVKTRGTDSSAIFNLIGWHVGPNKDAQALSLVAQAFGARADQEDQSGNQEAAQGWRTRQAALTRQIASLQAAV